MSATFPVRITPLPEESLPSLLRRLSTTTDIPLDELYPHPLHELLVHFGAWYVTPHRDAAELLGLSPEETLEHTLVRRDIFIDNTPEGIIYRDPIPLMCPGCGTTSIWAHLVLVTSCHRCGLLFSDDPDAHVAPTPEAVEMQRAYLATVTGDPASDTQRIRRLWRLHGLDRCAPWLRSTDHPAHAGSTASHPVHAAHEAKRRSPSWISEFARRAWPPTETPTTYYAHIVKLVMSNSGHSSAADDEASGGRSELHAELRRLDLTLSTVPEVVMDCYRSGTAQCHAEELGFAISRALKRELECAVPGGESTWWDETWPYEVWPKIGVAGLVQYLRESADGRRLLLHEAERIAAHGPVDYRARAETLKSLHAVPRGVLIQAGLPPSTPQRPKSKDITRIAAAWIWLELVRGALGDRTHYSALRKDVQRFDAQLAPEARLVLLEYGEQLLTAVETDVGGDHDRTSRLDRRTDVG